MGFQVGMAAVAGAGVMLLGYLLDFPLIISLAASLGTMGFLAFRGGKESTRKKDNRLFLPNEEPPTANS